jgi:flagellar M-ring protein FliF
VVTTANSTDGSAGGTATTAITTALTTALDTTAVDDQMLTRVIGSAAGIDTTRGDTIEVAIVPEMATDTGALITDATADPAAAPVAPLTTVYAEAAGAGAVAMLLLVMMMRRRRKKKERMQALILGEPGSRKNKDKKNKDSEADAPTAVMPAVTSRAHSASSDPDRAAVDEIKGDLERMLNESPESLAALLSSWMAK